MDEIDGPNSLWFGGIVESWKRGLIPMNSVQSPLTLDHGSPVNGIGGISLRKLAVVDFFFEIL